VSSPATAAFLAAWRRHDAKRRTLATITLSVPSGRTLYYATAETFVDSQLYQAGLECESVRETISLLDPGLIPSTSAITLKKRDAFQADGDHVGELLSAYLFQNAVVNIYDWVEGAGLTSADLCQVFRGNVARPIDISFGQVSLVLMQDLSWNKQTPPTVVDKVSYPNSPDVSQGLPVPTIYGDHRSPGMRAPWSAAYTNKSKQEDSGAGIGVVPLVLVDAGVGNAKVKIVGAGHLLADLLDRTTGHSAYIVGEQTLAPIDTGGITETLGASESFLEIADENAIAYAAIIPVDVRASENTASEPRRAMDPFDETTYATLDQGAGKTTLQLILPNLSALGRLESVQFYVGYSGDAANPNNMRIQARNPATGFGATSANWAAASATPAVQTGTWNAADYTQNWDFGSGGTAHPWDVRIDFVAGATNKGRIYWVVLVGKYRPQRSTVTPGGVSTTYRLEAGYKTRRSRNYLVPVTTIIPETFRLDGQFFGNPKGYADDGSGTYTGVASALIERPCDIAQHFLATYGGVSGGNIETGATAFGSFALARSLLRNAQPTDLKMAVWIGQRTTVQRALQALAAQSGMCIYLDSLSNKWLCFVWKPGAVPDYDLTFSWFAGDIADFSCEETSVVDVRHAIRVKYGFDYYKNKTLYEAFVNSGASSQGLNLPTIRDQRLVVSASNHDLDFIELAVRHVTLASANYAPIDLAVELQTKVQALGGAMADHVFGYGFSVKTGFNDLFRVKVGGTPYVATLNPADYTAEGFATELARALTAAHANGWACTYDHSANKFTLTGTSSFVIDVTGATTTNAVMIFGMTIGHSPLASTSLTADLPRYGGRIWAESSSLCNYLWASGANQSTNCADLLGFPRTDSGLTTDTSATYSRGDRERNASTYEGYYGPREENQITADWIRDETTAVQLRDRIFDLSGRPRVLVHLKSYRCPDIRRMQVIQFSSDLDAIVPYPKYGTNGSWAGKSFVVLEIEKSQGPQYHTQLLAIEAD